MEPLYSGTWNLALMVKSDCKESPFIRGHLSFLGDHYRVVTLYWDRL